MLSICKPWTPWWWLGKVETCVMALDYTSKNTVHLLVVNLWFVIRMHGEYNVKKCITFKETRRGGEKRVRVCANHIM
jgi:hypothetical protein